MGIPAKQQGPPKILALDRLPADCCAPREHRAASAEPEPKRGRLGCAAAERNG